MNAHHLDDDALISMALEGSGDSAESPDGAEHLRGCGSCRARYERVRQAIDSVLPAIPALEPPAGFDDRVLAAMGMSAGQSPTNRPAAVPEPTPIHFPDHNSVDDNSVDGSAADRDPAGRKRWWLLPAVAALIVGVTLGAGVTWVLSSGDSQVQTIGTPLTTADGSVVGSVSAAVTDASPVLVVSIAGAPDQANYLCRMTMTDGSTQNVGPWTLPGGTGSWVVSSVAPAQVSMVELLRPDGSLWSEAHLPVTAEQSYGR